MRARVVKTLRARGFIVVTPRNPAEFLKSGAPEGINCLVIGNQPAGGPCPSQLYAEIQTRGWMLPCIVLSSDWTVRSVVDTLRTGVEGFLARPVDEQELIYEVQRALEKARRNQVANLRLARLNERAGQLTPRERSIVALVVAGHINKEIADQLDLAVVTVKVHRGRAMRKLGAGNAAELAHLAVLAGIARPPMEEDQSRSFSDGQV